MSKEAMKLALEALEAIAIHGDLACVVTPDGVFYLQPAITALREALAEQALDKMAENARELGLDYEPAQRTWVYLTDEEIRILAGSLGYGPYVMEVVRAAEAKLKEKNNG